MVIALREYTVQLPISPLATPILPTKVATVEALRSSMRQCSSCSGYTHLQLLNRVVDTPICNCSIVSFFLTLKLNAQLKPRLKYYCAKKTLNLHPSDLCWNAYRSQVGFSKPARPSPLSWNK